MRYSDVVNEEGREDELEWYCEIHFFNEALPGVVEEWFIFLGSLVRLCSLLVGWSGLEHVIYIISNRLLARGIYSAKKPTIWCTLIILNYLLKLLV